MRVTARVNIELSKSANYIPMGFWRQPDGSASKPYYRITDLGIPMVKRPAGTSLGYTVWVLNTDVSNASAPDAGGNTQWKLIDSLDIIYAQNAYIEFLQAQAISLRTAGLGARTEIDPSGMRIYNEAGLMNIQIGNKNGYAVLEYYDNDGNFLYDLGPAGLSKLEVREERWTDVTDLVYLGTSLQDVLSFPNRHKYTQPYAQPTTTYYRYTSKIVAGINQDTNNDGKLFVSKNKAGDTIPLGLYCKKERQHMRMAIKDQPTFGRIYPPGISEYNEAVYDRDPLYFTYIYSYESGLARIAATAYWNDAYDSNF